MLPFFPIALSCLVSVYQLTKKSPFSRDGATQLKKKYASQTIVLVTIIYIVLNFPVCIFILLEVIEVIMQRFGYEQNFILGHHMNIQIYLRLLLAVYCVGINAAINPIVYLCRFKGFKMYSNNLSKQVRARIKYIRDSNKSREMSKIPQGIKLITYTDPLRLRGRKMYELEQSSWSVVPNTQN
jgi:hypothetical protein